MMERWKKINEWQEYEVSNMGNVRKKHKDGTFRYIKVQPNKNNGYIQVMLRNKEAYKLVYLHRLVGEAFCQRKSEELNQIFHLNGDKSDNRASNLCWKSKKKQVNLKYGIYYMPKITVKTIHHYIVSQIIPNTNLVVATYRDGWEELAKRGYRREPIMRVGNGTYHKDVYKGFQWKVERIDEKIKLNEDNEHEREN